MQIHELNTYAGTLGSGSYLAIDNGIDTGKISSQGLLAATEARIDNIIAGPAPSAQEVTDARLGADGITYNSLGTAIRTQAGNLKSDINAVDSKMGLVSGVLTTNNKYPYIDVPVNIKAGDWILMSLEYYSGDLSNLVRWYAYNPDTGATVRSPLTLDSRNNVKATSDISNLRFIFQLQSAVVGLYVVIKTYVYGNRQLLDIADNYGVYEATIDTTANTQVHEKDMNFYAKKGDYFEVELIDEDGVISSSGSMVIGYMDGASQVSNVMFLSASEPKAVAQIQTDINPDSLIAFVNAQYITAAGTLKLRYKNLTSLGIEPSSGAGGKKYTSFSILGDSYSSFAGYTNPTTNRQWYPTDDPSAQGYNTGNDVTSLENMWWYLLADETELYLNENASYSGSTICYDSYGDGSADGKEHSFIQRMDDAGKSSLLFIFGGTNDDWAGASIGEYKYSGWTESDLSYFAPALAYLIYNLKRKYVGTDIVFIQNDSLSAEYKTAINTVCGHYSVPVIKPSNVSKTYNHPNISGMRQIADAVENWLAD